LERNKKETSNATFFAVSASFLSRLLFSSTKQAFKGFTRDKPQQGAFSLTPLPQLQV
jgi:hypothetical protein